MLMFRDRMLKSQNGYVTAPGQPYNIGANDCSFAVGQTIFVRLSSDLIKGSVINSARLRVNVNAKDNTVAQTSTHTVRAHNSGDSPVLMPGYNEVDRRAPTAASTNWVCNYPANPADLVNFDIDVKAMVQELVNRSDFQTGGYITFMITCTDEAGSDLMMRLNNDFLPAPNLEVDYTPPASDVVWTINRCENSELNTLLSTVEPVTPSTNPPLWAQNQFYGAYVDPASFAGLIESDSAFVRKSGIPTLRFTCAAPDSANPNAYTGPVYGLNSIYANVPFMFSGWIYVPSSVPSSAVVVVGDPFRADTWQTITERGVWTPFATVPFVDTDGTSELTLRWAAVGIRGHASGNQFWISEPTILESPIRQMPFNALTPPPNFAEHQPTSSRMQSVRKLTPRTTMMVNGLPKRMPTWSKRSSGIFESTEPIKGGPQIQQLDSVAISSLPAGVTVAEL